jgi:EmrB/QacA subfamily drug resistance transporter
MTFSGDRRATTEGVGDHRWTILVGMCLITAVTEFDETVMAVALPRIDASFDASLPAVQWSVTGYVLAFAAVLIPAGRLADSVGPRRVFLAGAGVFAAGSAACALAPDVGWLIGARVVQGLGAATITPASFAIVVHAFGPDKRGRALGLWAAAVAVGAAVGPLGGGLLIDLFGWEAIFVMGIPIAVAAIGIAAAVVPGGGGGTARAPGLPSVALLGAGLTLLLLGLGEANGVGFLPGSLAILLLGLALLLALAFSDARQRHPLLNLGLFRIRSYAGVNAVMLVAATAWLAMLLLQGIYLQSVRGLSALEAGLALMPLTAAAVLSAPVSGHFADRVGARSLIVAGMCCLVASLALLALVDAATSYWPQLFAAYALNGVGWGMLQTPIETDAVRSVGEPQAGFVSGFLGMTYQLGAAVGIVAATAAIQALGSARLDARLREQGVTTTALERAGLTKSQVEGKLGTHDVLSELPGLRRAQAARVAQALRDSFLHALTTTMAISAAVVAAGAVLALLLFGQGPRASPPPAVQDA